jgi:antitoxin (DNA-binding transcriptional repressor) of toxin-antitoxin stability system
MSSDVKTRPQVSAEDLSARAPELIQRAASGEARILLTHQGNACAAMVSLEDLRELEAWERLEEQQDLVACREYDEARSRGELSLMSAAEVRRRLGL